MMTRPIDDLAAHAHETRVVVVGAGIAGLVAALECAKVGLRVTVLEQQDAVGGTLRTAELDGVVVDIAADGYSTRGGVVRALIDELDLGGDVVAAAENGAWVAGLPGAAPLPAGVIGIPANPLGDEVRRIIGWSGALRAYVDRLRPPLTIGHERSLGRLVRGRMGDRVLDLLVAPVTRGDYGVEPDDIDPEIAAPGLMTALTRLGSLSGAVSSLQDAHAGRIESLSGGIGRLPAAIEQRLGELGAEVRTNATTTALEQTDAGWRVVYSAPSEKAPSEAAEVEADIVIVATAEAQARALLAPVVPALGEVAPTGTEVEVVTLLVDAPALDAHPRGRGVYPVSGTSVARALTHVTARWPERSPASGVHVVRITLAPSGDADADVIDRARREAVALLGVELDAGQVRGARRDRFVQARPSAAGDHEERARTARDAAHAVTRLGVVGAWLAGAGLAQVVPDAIAEAERVRRGALWGEWAAGL